MTKRALITFISLLVCCLSGLVWLSCSIEQPSVGKDDEETKFQHADFTEENACTECHEEDRPAPDHGAGLDCRTCHDSNDDKKPFLPKEGITSSGEAKTDTEETTDTETDTATATEENDPTKVFEHEAGLTSCTACHEKDRAPPPHVESGDCAACHESNNVGGPWKPK
jgi:hypothetical protein